MIIFVNANYVELCEASDIFYLFIHFLKSLPHELVVFTANSNFKKLSGERHETDTNR